MICFYICSQTKSIIRRLCNTKEQILLTASWWLVEGLSWEVMILFNRSQFYDLNLVPSRVPVRPKLIGFMFHKWRLHQSFYLSLFKFHYRESGTKQFLLLDLFQEATFFFVLITKLLYLQSFSFTWLITYAVHPLLWTAAPSLYHPLVKAKVERWWFWPSTNVNETIRKC